MSHDACIRRPRFFLLLVSFLCFSACHSGDKSHEPVEVQVHYVGFDPAANSPVVVLQEKGGERTMPIWIGVAEAQAIALQLRGATPPRPLTHDLLKTILDQAGVEFDHVLVNNMKDGAYYARIHLVNGRKTLEVDSRPSDAIALAMRFHRPIFVEPALLDAAPNSIIVAEQKATKDASTSPANLKLFGVTVQELNENLAKHFGMPEGQGVLVIDVEGESGGEHLQRGDVIIAASGEVVHSVDDFQQKLQNEQRQEVSLRVRRNGEDIDASLTLTPEESSHTKEEAE